jgi:hypothetical protein
MVHILNSRLAATTAAALIAAAATTGIAVGKAQTSKALPVPADVYAGWSAQNDPMWFSVSAGGRRITDSSTAIDVTCTPSGAKFTTVDGLRGIPVAANRHFSAHGALPLTTSPDGSKFSESDAITGIISADHKTIRGTWTLNLVFIPPPGSTTPTDTCTSRPVAFKIHS